MTRFLYTEKNVEKLNKEKNCSRNIFVILLVTLALIFALTIIFATYQTRTIFIAVACALSIVDTAFTLYFMYKLIYLKRLSKEFTALINAEKTKKIITIKSVSKHIITLPDKSRCYEIVAFVNKSEKTFYLSEVFDSEFEIDKTYMVKVAFDYITEYTNED